MKSDYRFSIILTTVSVLILITLAACGVPQTSPKSQSNRPPVIQQITGVNDWSPDSAGQFGVIASDPDGDKLTYTWLAENGTLTGDGDSVSWTSPSAMGKYKITVVASDGRGGETRQVKEVRVIINADGTQTLDAPVVLTISFPSSDNVTASKRCRIWTASPVDCLVTGADPKDLKFTWTTSNGKIQAKGLNEGTARSVIWIAPGVGGDWTLDVLVTDRQGNQAKGTVKFNVYCCGNY
jgi:hypothetical protein